MIAPGTICAAELERTMKLQDVILKAMAKKITWMEAAEIAGVTDLRPRACVTATRPVVRRGSGASPSVKRSEQR
jgi:hypothetical protein